MPSPIPSAAVPPGDIAAVTDNRSGTVPASFRFYEELNDFIAPDRRRRDFDFAVAPDASIKHVIEALGVPHTEVELILVNGESVGFSRRLRPGDRVSVYPTFETFDITPLLRLRPAPLRVTRFIADAHLGGLARLLRMAGFDTLYDNHFDDIEIERIAARDGRIVLTRDRELLKRRGISHGCYVHELKSGTQLGEILARLDLTGSVRPFSLCLECNAPLSPVDKSQVLDTLPTSVRQGQQRFSTCPVCRRVFWEGSHWRHMNEQLATALAAARVRQEALQETLGETKGEAP